MRINESSLYNIKQTKHLNQTFVFELLLEYIADLLLHRRAAFPCSVKDPGRLAQMSAVLIVSACKNNSEYIEWDKLDMCL